MTLPSAWWRESEGLPRLLEALDVAAGATRFVGGVVRDRLLSLPAHDIDLATRLLPEVASERIAAAGFAAIPTGIAHGTVTAILPGGPVEVTTLRCDVATDGRRALVAFGTSWEEDAARRDFTVNALSADPATGTVFDYFGGLGDLAAGRVRFIGDATTRIAEDHLRILRFFRFHARFGRGAPDPVALAAATARANDLMALSRERIADELLKLLALPDPMPTVSLMMAHGILRPILPEIGAIGLARLQRLIARETAFAIAPDPLRRLAALLPDPAVAAAVGARLRLSNAARRRLEQAARPLPPATPARHLRAAHPEIDILDRLLPDERDDREIATALASLQDWTVPTFALKGGDLVRLGLRPGPEVARLLAELRQEWIDADFPDAEWVAERAAAAVDQRLRDIRNA